MKKLLLLTLNFILFISAEAASRYWVSASSSNWNSASNWSATSGGAGGAGIPGSGDMAYFNSAANGSCSIDANANVAGFSISGYSGTITQGSGYTITIGTSNFAQSSGTFTGGNSSIDMNGSFGLTGGTFTSTTGTLYVATGWNHTTSGTFNHNSGTVCFDGAGGWYINLLSNNETFYNVTMDQTGGIFYFLNTNDKITVNGNIIFSRGGIWTWNNYAASIEVYGNVTVLSTFGASWQNVVTLVFAGTANQNFDNSGATDVFNGILQINKSSGIVTLLSNLTMNGTSQNMTLTSGTLNLNSYTLSNTTGICYCTGTFTISGTGTFSVYGWSQTSGTPILNISGSSNFTVGASNYTHSTGTFTCNSAVVDMNGNFNFSGGTFTAPSGTFYLSGNWYHNTSGTFTHNSGTVCFDGTGNSQMFMISNLETFYNVTVNKTGGGVLTMISLNDRALINGNLILTSGSIQPNNSGEAKTLEVLGNVTVASTFVDAAVVVTLKFSGTATQYFDLTGATALYNGHIEINKSAGSVILSSNLTMDAAGQALSFTLGTLNLNSYTLTNTAGTTYCSGSFVVSGTGTFTNYAWSQSSGAAAFSISGASNFTINSSFSISQGTFSAGTATTFDINGAFNLSGGTFTAPSGIMYISGAWNHNTGGTFNHNNGTVCFDGTGTANMFMISNLETFYSVTVNKTSGGYIAMISLNDRALINGNLTLTNGSIYPNNSGEAKTLEVLGNVTVASTFIEAATVVTLKFSGTATQYFDLTGATALFNGKIQIDKSAGSVVLSSNLTMDAAGQDLSFTSGTLNLNSYTLTNTAGTTYCSGAFAVSGTGTLVNYAWSQTSGAANFSITGASNFTINGNFSISLGTFSAGSATTFDINGAFNLTGGTYTAPAGTMYISGSWNHSTAGTFNHNNGTVYFDGAGTINMFMISNLETFYNVTVDKASGAIAMISINDKAIINGNLTLTNGSIYPNNGGEAKTLEVLGDVSVSNTFSSTSAEVALNFTGSTAIQNFTFTGTTTRINGNITVNKTSGKVNLGSGVTVYTGKVFTVTVGTLNCLNQVVSGPTFTLSSGATLELGSTGGIASSGATGNIQTTTRTFNTGSYYVYSGISGAQVTGTGLPSTIAGLTINNSSGVTLTASETINTLFTLTSGNLSLGTFDVVMASGSSISGGSSSSFVYTGSTGFLKYNSCAASSTKTFPVGHTNSSAGYVPLVMTFNVGHTTDNFSVIAVDKVTNDGDRNGTAYTSTVVKTMWYITETTSGNSNVTMQFQWNGTDEATGFVRSSCFMSHYTNSAWEKPGTDGSASGSNPYTFTYSNYTGTFSPFGMGGSGGPLPVELLYFKARNQNGTGRLSWATASEINNDYFTIEKSTDGKNFETIGKIRGAGNSQQILKYMFTDSNLDDGINYYRLKQTDYNGEFSYSDIEIISDFKENENKIKLSLYPVPASDFINVELNSIVDLKTQIQIVNILGTTVSEKSLTLQRGYNHFEMEVNNLPEGVYFIQIQGLENYQSTRFSIQK